MSVARALCVVCSSLLVGCANAEDRLRGMYELGARGYALEVGDGRTFQGATARDVILGFALGSSLKRWHVAAAEGYIPKDGIREGTEENKKFQSDR